MAIHPAYTPAKDGTPIPVRTESTRPDAYRLARKPDGTLVLQGMFKWMEGHNAFGHTWRDLPTVDVDIHGKSYVTELDKT